MVQESQGDVGGEDGSEARREGSEEDEAQEEDVKEDGNERSGHEVQLTAVKRVLCLYAFSSKERKKK